MNQHAFVQHGAENISRHALASGSSVRTGANSLRLIRVGLTVRWASKPVGDRIRTALEGHLTKQHWLVALIMLVPCLATADDSDFNRDVRPILADNCFECHGPDAEARQGDLRLDVLDDALGSVIDPGKPDASTLIERLLSKDNELVMPPPESKRRPTPQQIETLRKWIAQGANYEGHWAFVKPTRPDVPSVASPPWLRNAIDSFVLAHLDAQSLKPQPTAAPRVLARRLSLVLTGLPILPDRSEQFVKAFNADADRAVGDLVDELLSSKAYGEHFAWGWMDAARYADTNGYQADGYRVMWPWRDWLVRNLNANLPFDKLTQQMLAGDLLLPEGERTWESADWIPNDTSSDLLTATGFLRNHRYDTGSGTIPAESKFENAADRMETVGTVWMGLTMLCARCHSHKYDPIENREYYELLSFFDNVPEVGSALKGASHPYIHVPTSDQRAELNRLQTEAANAQRAFNSAIDEIAKAQAAWEAGLGRSGTLECGDSSPLSINCEPESGKTLGSNEKLRQVEALQRVTRGLKFRYAEKPLHCDGNTSIEKDNKPVAICAGNKRWTISFWFRPKSATPGAIFSSVEEPDRYRPGIQADWIGGRIRVRHVCRWVNSYIEFTSKERLTPGRWYHVTFRCDGRMQGLAYAASLNGSGDGMVCSHPVTNDSAEKSGKAPLVLGGSPLMRGFSGSLRDLRFYDRQLEPSEVRSLADARSMAQLARIPVGKRSADEVETLRLAFLESEALPAELQQLRDDKFAAAAKLDDAVRDVPTVMVMQQRKTEHTRIRKAGVFDSLGEQVETTTPSFLPPLTRTANSQSTMAFQGRRDADTDGLGRPSYGPTRLDLARWLTQPNHPLTARVAVNRIWQTLWGRGFVDSPENFGTQCAKPIHADLLDWLATEYVRLGWDTKALIKLIVTSRTYRQSSGAAVDLWRQDPQNRHLARGPRFRLPVPVVRDQALLLSGRLDPTIGGPPVVVDEVRGKDAKPMRVPFAATNNRRTLYTFWKRNSPHPMLAVFDVADRNQCEVRTMRTNTPLQALVTLNEPGFAACASALGTRFRAMSQSEAEQLGWLWQACTGRIPDATDMQLLQNTLKDYRRTSNNDEYAAWSALCNVVLNLDATLNLE